MTRLPQQLDLAGGLHDLAPPTSQARLFEPAPTQLAGQTHIDTTNEETSTMSAAENIETVNDHKRMDAQNARTRAAMGYAAKFYAETWGAEPRDPRAPTDANLRAQLSGCALPVPSSLFPAIRAVLRDEYGVGIV